MITARPEPIEIQKKRKPAERLSKQQPVLVAPLRELYTDPFLRDRLMYINRCGMIPYVDVPVDDTFFRDRQLQPSDIQSQKALQHPKTAENTPRRRFFVLAIDRDTRELTDTGGSVDIKLDTSLIQTAIRETREETLQVIDDLLPARFDEVSLLNSAIAVTDFRTLILFVKIDCNRDRINAEFHKRLRYAIKPEVVGLRWFDTAAMAQLVFRRRRMYTMYYKVHRLLKRAGNFYSLLP